MTKDIENINRKFKWGFSYEYREETGRMKR